MELIPSRVILHCSATPDYPDSSKKYDLFGAADIKQWHVNERGWSDIGYHFVIRRTGVIEQGRSIKIQGAHCLGQNRDSLGVCLIGTRWPTEEQIKSLIRLFRQVRRSFKIEASDWFGHYEFNSNKTCPGFSMHLFRELLQYGIKHEKAAVEKSKC